MRARRGRSIVWMWVAVVLSQPLAAEVPLTINYQGRVLDVAGGPAPGPVDLEIRIWDSASGGAPLYAEQHPRTPLTGGIFSLLLGTGSNTTGSFDANTFAAAGRWLELTIDGETLSPRQPFSAVAYAFRAQHAVTADSVGGIDGAALMPRSGGTFTGNVTVSGPNGNGNIALGSIPENPNHGSLGVLNANGQARATMLVDATGRGTVSTFNSEGKLVTLLSGTDSGGLVGVLNTAGTVGGLMSTTANGGFISLVGKSGKNTVLIGPADDNPNHGIVSMRDETGSERASLFVDAAGNGHVSVRGVGATEVFGGTTSLHDANGTVKILLAVDAATQGVIDVANANGRLAGFMRVQTNGNGIIGVTDENSVTRAGMLVNSAGRGQLFADTKNFVVDHPTRPGFQIIYTSLEGPEVAIYHRGRVRLVDGRATIELPEHFAVLAVPDSLTVQLTPVSLESKGLGVAAISGDRIEIGELQQGRGTYDVHFVVHALRRGYEDQQPVVAKTETLLAPNTHGVGFPLGQGQGEGSH